MSIVLQKQFRMFGIVAYLALTGCSEVRSTERSGQLFADGDLNPFVTSVGDRVFFEFDRSALTTNARIILDRQAVYIGKFPTVTVQVAGNCDERGTEEYNLALGMRRAVAVEKYLRSKGVSGIATISYGKDRPTAVGSNEQAWQQNRNAITDLH